MPSLYSELMKNADLNYDNGKVTAYIMVIKKTKNVSLQRQAKYKLYFCLSKIFVKAVNNFSSLTKTVPPQKLLHSQEDIAIECFLVLDKCVEKLDMKYLKQFYFYLNSALNRAIYRIYEKEYKKKSNVIENTDENEFLVSNKGYNQHLDCSSIDLSHLTELERDVLDFKLSGDKLSKFLKKQNIPSTRYYQVYESAKEKIFNVYQHDEYFTNNRTASA